MFAYRSPKQTGLGQMVVVSYGDGHTAVLKAEAIKPDAEDLRTAGSGAWRAISQENGFADDIYRSDLDPAGRNERLRNGKALEIASGNALEGFVK